MMTFEEYWQAGLDRGLPDRAELKTAAKCAWDAAICSAQAACLEDGKIVRKGGAIMDRLHRLHSWTVQPQPTRSDTSASGNSTL